MIFIVCFIVFFIMVSAAAERRKERMTYKELIPIINEILEQYDFALTVRQIYYRLISDPYSLFEAGNKRKREGRESCYMKVVKGGSRQRK